MLVLLLPNPSRFNKQTFINRLSRQDKKNALSLRNSDARAQFIAGRLLIKEALLRFENGKFINNKIYIDKQGKPTFRSNLVHFNISHTKKLVVCAIGHNCMGIDIEMTNRKIKLPLNIVHGNTKHNYNFIKRWVLLEACAKLTGKGLSQILKNKDISTFQHYEKTIMKHYLAIAMYQKERVNIIKTNKII
jgi:4'-phosphopantetheinyl transferase